LAKTKSKPRYKRVLLKISGEALAGSAGFGIDAATVKDISRQIKDVMALGCQLGLVVGGGNIFRGQTGEKGGLDRVTGDKMGMLATVVNALALQNALEKQGVMTRVQTAFEISKVAELFIDRRAIRHLEKGRVVIFAGGTGNPYFSTDTAAVLRALEVKADILMKATQVDGIYTADPTKDKNARRFKRLAFHEALSRRLKVMDMTAFSLCEENHLPVLVFNLHKDGNIRRAVTGEEIGTMVS
jgi:uridylate kinase